MQVGKAIAKPYLGGNGNKAQEEVEPNAYFCAKIVAPKLDEVFRITGFGIAGQVNIVFYPRHHVHFKIVDAVAIEF